MVGFSYHLTTSSADFKKLCPPDPATLPTAPMSPFEDHPMLYGQWSVEAVSSQRVVAILGEAHYVVFSFFFDSFFKEFSFCRFPVNFKP